VRREQSEEEKRIERSRDEWEMEWNWKERGRRSGIGGKYDPITSLLTHGESRGGGSIGWEQGRERDRWGRVEDGERSEEGGGRMEGRMLGEGGRGVEWREDARRRSGRWKGGESGGVSG